MRNAETTKDTRELTQNELLSVTGGSLLHFLTPLAVIATGAVLIGREITTGKLNGHDWGYR